MNLQEFANKHNLKIRCFKMPGKAWSATAICFIAKHGKGLKENPEGLGQTVIEALNNLSEILSNSMIIVDVQNKEYPNKIDQIAFNVPQLEDITYFEEERNEMANTSSHTNELPDDE